MVSVSWYTGASPPSAPKEMEAARSFWSKCVWDRWHKEGAKTLQEKARTKSLKLIQEHDTEIVPKDVREEIDAIIKAAIQKTS